ncbi:MAG: hypothetical protein ACTSQY_07885 [Candidatus Odinarchaeia archaeon]
MDEESSKLQWSRTEPISVPSPSMETRMAIRKMDWDRCKRRINGLTIQDLRITKLYSTFTGIAISFFYNWIKIRNDINDPFNVALNLVTWIAAIVIAVGFYWLEKNRENQFSKNKSEILDDMKDIENTFSKFDD